MKVTKNNWFNIVEFIILSICVFTYIIPHWNLHSLNLADLIVFEIFTMIGIDYYTKIKDWSKTKEIKWSKTSKPHISHMKINTDVEFIDSVS